MADQRIEVSVQDAVVSVSPSTINAAKVDGALVFAISTKGYRFGPNGVVIASSDRYSCATGGDARTYRCSKRGHEAGASFKVQINVVPEPGAGTAPAQQPQAIFVQES